MMEIQRIQNGVVRRAKRCKDMLVNRDFLAIEKAILDVEGLLVDGQERWLYLTARSLPDPAVIVEIGGYKGRSTCSLGFACRGTEKRIFTIDTFNGNESDFQGEGRTDFFKEWEKNIEQNQLRKYVTPLVGYSQEVAKQWDKNIDFLFIDGSHEYEDVLADLQNFYPYVKKGGIIALHDVLPNRPGPRRVWEEHAKKMLIKRGALSSIAFGRKP